MKLFFYLFSIIAVAGSLLVVTLKNIMHSALFLAITLLSMAGLFFVLNADFIAAVQILVYAGGIMVLIVFAILLTQKITGKLEHQTNDQKAITFIFSAIVLVVLLMTILETPFKIFSTGAGNSGTTGIIGEALLGRYVLPFEIASIVILAVIVASIMIARKED